MSTAIPRTRLGTSDLMVSRFALGTMTFGHETDEGEARRMLDTYVGQGGNFIDTADVYGGPSGPGASEAILGRWLRDRDDRDDLVIATKGRFNPPEGVAGNSRAGLTAALEGSLTRLGLDHVDLYLVHGWDKDTPLEETLTVLGEMVREGKVGAIGFSNVSGWQLARIVSLAPGCGCPVPVSLQPQYNLLERGIEVEVMPCAVEAGVSITPWSPLGGGWLTAKYTAQARPTGATRLGEDPGRGVEAYDLRNTDRTYRILDVLGQVAARHDCAPEHVAFAWLAQRPGVAAVLLGARTLDQLTSNLSGVGVHLDEADMRALSEVSATGLPPYPYGFLEDWSGLTIWKEMGT